MRLLPVLATATLASLAVSPAEAGPKVAVGGGLGTTGAGVQAQVELNDWIGLRGDYNVLQYSVEDTYDDVAYEGDLDMSTFGAYVDLRPFQNSFLVTGGMVFGDKKLESIASPTTNVDIGDQTFTPDQVGVLDMRADLGDTAPMFGLGFDTTFQGDGPFGFKLIVGAMFTDSPNIELTSRDGLLSDDPTFIAEVEQEELNLEEDIEDFKVWPVLQAGITFRF